MTKTGQQQRRREEVGMGDSLQLLEGKLEWWKPLASHPEVLWLGLHPVSFHDLPLLLLLPLSNSSASNSYMSLLSVSSPENPWLAGSERSLPHQTLLQNMLAPCSATISQSFLFELSNPLFHQPSDSSSAFQGRQWSSLSCSFVSIFSLSFPLGSTCSSGPPRSSTCFFVFFIFRCPIDSSWTQGREPSRLMLELWPKFCSEHRQHQQWVWGLGS